MGGGEQFVDKREWLNDFVDRCQTLCLDPTALALDRLRTSHASRPDPLPPDEESVVRQVLARTLYSTCRRAADGPSEISGTILRVVVGSDFGVDCTRALDRCASHLGLDSPSVGYAARRWAALIIPVTRLRDDVPTLWAWSRHVAKSQSTIKTWCAAAGVHGGDSLDFARLLRVSVLYAGRAPDWYNVLAVIDGRTLARLLDRGGINRGSQIPDPEVFLRNQHLISSPVLLAAVRTVLTSVPD